MTIRTRIQQIIDQLLQLSALEARKGLGPTEQFDARGFIEECIRALAPATHARGVNVTLAVADGLRLCGEQFLLALAVTNLLKNAVEFSPPGATIQIEVKRDRHEVRIVVDDAGPGIPAFALGRIFERFYSLPRPGTVTKSTGLGLSFVRETAHLHGGDVQVSNREGGGCRAELVLTV